MVLRGKVPQIRCEENGIVEVSDLLWRELVGGGWKGPGMRGGGRGGRRPARPER